MYSLFFNNDSLIYPCLGFAGLSLFLARTSLVPAMLAPFVSLCLLLWCGYVAGMTYTFHIVSSLWVWCGVGLGAIALFMPRGALYAQEYRFLPEKSAVLLLSLFLLGSWYYHGAQFRAYDEYFWGTFAKSFIHEGGVWTSNSALARDDMTMAYPPLPAVLLSIFMPLSGYREDACAMGGLAIVVSLAFVAYHYTRQEMATFQAAALAVLTACWVRLIGAHIHHYYVMAYMEYVLAAFFTTLLCVVFFEKKPRRMLLLLLLGLPLAGLIKQTGMILSLCVMCCACLRMWFIAQKNGNRLLPFMPLAAFIPMVAAYGWWTAHTAQAVTHDSGLNDIFDITSLIADPELWTSIKVYAWAFVERSLIKSPAFGRLPFVFSSLSLICIVAMTLFYARNTVRITADRLYPMLFLICGFAGWVVLHWVSALAFFSYTELYNAESYERYAGTFAAGLWGIFFMLFVLCINEAGKHKTVWLCIGGAAAAITLICTVLPWQRPQTFKPEPIYTEMNDAAHYLAARIPTGSRFAFVPFNGNKAEDWALRYFLAPKLRGTSILPNFLKTSTSPRKPSENNIALPAEERIIKLLRDNNVDYLFVYRRNEEFIAKCPKLVKGRNTYPMLLSKSDWQNLP